TNRGISSLGILWPLEIGCSKPWLRKKLGGRPQRGRAYRKNSLEKNRDWRLARNQAGKTMKSDPQGGFVKMQRAILDRFDDRDARHVYEDLLCLMDHEG